MERRHFILGALAPLAGCASLKAGSSSGTVAASSTTQPLPRQEGFLQLEISSTVFDPSNGAYKILSETQTPEVRVRRARELGPAIEAAIRTGTVKGYKPTRYQVFFWGIDPNKKNFFAYRRDGKAFGRTSFKDVTATANSPEGDQTAGALGKAECVIEVETSGSDANMVALQFPWELLGKSPHILICSMDKGGQHFPFDQQGQGIRATFINGTMRAGNVWEYAQVPFVYKSGSSTKV